VSDAARAGGRDDVACVVLGAGADEDTVAHWLREAAGVDAGGVPRVRALLSLGRGRARTRA